MLVTILYDLCLSSYTGSRRITGTASNKGMPMHLALTFSGFNKQTTDRPNSLSCAAIRRDTVATSSMCMLIISTGSGFLCRMRSLGLNGPIRNSGCCAHRLRKAVLEAINNRRIGLIILTGLGSGGVTSCAAKTTVHGFLRAGGKDGVTGICGRLICRCNKSAVP